MASNWRVNKRVVVAGFVLFALAFVACGSSEPAAPLERVVDNDRYFVIEDLKAVGMKASKQYDVAELPFGEDAWYGFIQTDNGPLDIEVRFYASHFDAIEFGTDLAEEVSGDDADIDEDTTTWPVGNKDRQRMRSGGSSDLSAWSGKRGPNYADFVIYGNMVLLCQGDEPEISIETCYELIDALIGDE
ncbi:hypothetical protein JYU04_04435 [Dehalococcoides mccartyi]|nr:hypothetical protein [Dehalococcoides mccartyi]